MSWNMLIQLIESVNDVPPEPHDTQAKNEDCEPQDNRPELRHHDHHHCQTPVWFAPKYP